VVNADVGVVVAVKKDKKTTHLPYSPDTVMGDIVSLDEEEEPCDFEPPRRSLFFAAKNDGEQQQQQQQQQQQTVYTNTMMLSSGAVSNMGTTTTTTKHDDSTFIFSSHDDNIGIHGQEEDEEDDDDDSLWPLDTVIMPEEDDARFLLGLSCSAFAQPSQLDFSRSLFSAEDNDVDHHHHHNEDDGGGNITETENLFFQYWTDQGTTCSTNQGGASNDMMMG
jgi:hypothetical protein